MNSYTVSWSIDITPELHPEDPDDADRPLPRRAAILAARWLRDAVLEDSGASILVVRDRRTHQHIATYADFGYGPEIPKDDIYADFAS